MQIPASISCAIRTVVMFFAVACVAGTAYAAGFALTENSAKELAVAYAGAAAIAEDGSTVWFNPAGMTRLTEQWHVTASYVDPGFQFSNEGSYQEVSGRTLPLLPDAGDGGDGGVGTFVPSAFYVRPLNESVYIGIGINAPFGLSTKYDRGWVGRYQAVESDLVTINVNPSLAIKLNDQLSVGIGVDINYIDAKLTNAIDFAAICAAAVAGPCPNGSTPGQGQFDGFVRNRGNDTSLGTNVGILWTLLDDTRIGVTYRSEIKHTLRGHADFTEPTTLGGFAALGPLGGALGAAFTGSDISSHVVLPDSASISLVHPLTRVLTITADATRTDWSDIPQLEIKFANPLTPSAAENLHWNATWRLSMGLILDINERWTVRTGYAYDDAPVPNGRYRTPRLPDNDRKWLSFGVSRRLSHALTVDVGYAHLFVDNAPIAVTGATGDVLRGDFDADADIFSVQVNYVPQ